jgi:putative flippase GtrA
MTVVRYFLVGGAAALIDLAVFSLLVKGLHQPWFEAALVSFCFSTTANYLLSIRFVFRSGTRFTRRRHEFGGVVLVSLAGLSINQAVLWLLIERFQLDPLVAKVVGIGIVFFWNYGIRKHFLFKVRT